MSSLNDLVSQVQHHAPVQPWSYHGTAPLPVQIFYNDRHSDPWTVKFVAEVKGQRRKWGSVSGRAIEEALRSAREVQDRVKAATEAASFS